MNAQTAVQHNTDQEKLNWLRLFRTENVGPITFYQLIENYGSAQNALDALPELSKKGGRRKTLNAPTTQSCEQELEQLHQFGGDIICSFEENYPLQLSALDDAPPVLSYMGDLSLTKRDILGVVGARNSSLNGQKFAQHLATELGKEDFVIASGLARGIDTAAHEGSLETGTIAVVAGGLDIVYPRENQQLYEQICDQGLIIAESPLGMEPIARHFPKRNRIVSGLSAGIIVIEATKRSGSLITARMAAEQGRDIYAVPGYPSDPRAQGPNKLIQDGAMLIQSADDIIQNHKRFGGTMLPPSQGNFFEDPTKQSPLSQYPLAQNMAQDNAPSLNDQIRADILSALSQMPTEINELSRSLHIPITTLQLALLEMELAGRLQRLSGNRVVLLDTA